ncbi:hypothetical protein ACF0H5_021324 [Mactra antiquata]
MDPKGALSRGWTLAEMVEETRGKLHLKERDANAFYESCEVSKLQSEEFISRLRKVNKRKRVELAKSICGDETVIRSAFHHRREELLSMQRYTAEKSIEVMDQKVCDSSKRLNCLKYDRKKRIKQLRELKDELDRMISANSSDYDAQREQEVRRIQNEMDKAIIKVGAAHNITRRYQAIMDKMQEEVRNFPTILDCLEDQVKKARYESQELDNMNEKAVRASEEARRDLHTMEREMYQAKRTRDQQLNEMRKEVEKRKEVADRADKKQRVALINDTSDSRQAKLQSEKIERQEKILNLEDAFDKIMNATHVSDMEDIKYRFEHQDQTFKQLRSMEREKMHKKNLVTEELSKLRKVFEEIKFTSERQILRGRKAVEAMAEYVHAEEMRRNNAVDTYQRNNKLLINLQSGITTLLEKLKEVRLKPPYHNFAKGDPMLDLQQCGHKIDHLLCNLGLKGGDLTPLYKVDNEKLHEYLEAKLPPDNIRIKIDTDDHSDSDEFHFDHDQENEGFTSRDDIKRQGQEILNSKLKPKKKKARKRNN